jgi:hypothetical protein
MYGLIFDCFEQFVIIHFGRAKWDTILRNTFTNYKETEERRLLLQLQRRRENLSLFRKIKQSSNHVQDGHLDSPQDMAATTVAAVIGGGGTTTSTSNVDDNNIPHCHDEEFHRDDNDPPVSILCSPELKKGELLYHGRAMRGTGADEEAPTISRFRAEEIILPKIDEIEENYKAEGWSTSLSYPDELFWSLCDVAAIEVNIPKDEVIRACGFYFIDFIRY